jgi:hypothetical protein
MLGQELQDTDELAGTGGAAMLPFQVGAQLPEHRGQLPAPVDIGMIERRRPATERGQVVQRIKDLQPRAIRALMPRDHLTRGHHFHVLHVSLDGYRLEGEHPRHAVGVAVKTNRLVFVDAPRPLQAGIEAVARQ